MISPDVEIEDYFVNLWNGTANLNVRVPEDAEVGELIEYNSRVSDIRETEIFESRFFVLITEAEKKTSGEQGERKKPASKDPGDDTHGLHGLNLPNVIRVYENEWDRYGFDRYDALHISKASEDNYDFFVNVDNWHLKTEQKGKTKTDPRILEARYMYGHVIIALALITDHKEDEDQITTIEELVQRVSRAISPFILPMVEELGSLELEDVALDTFEGDSSHEEPEVGTSINRKSSVKKAGDQQYTLWRNQ